VRPASVRPPQDSTSDAVENVMNKRVSGFGVARSAWLVVLSALGLMAVSKAASAGEPTAVQSRAQRDIESGAARLTKLAYVSSKRHTDLDYIKGVAYKDDSFDLTYKFSYRDSDNDPQTFTLRFEFDARGKLKDIKSVSWSSFWEPFNALKIAGVMLDKVAEELNK
jgi:hypothetical protein